MTLFGRAYKGGNVVAFSTASVRKLLVVFTAPTQLGQSIELTLSLSCLHTELLLSIPRKITFSMHSYLADFSNSHKVHCQPSCSVTRIAHKINT